MKFLAVFAAVLALGCATPAEWTVNDLAAAMQDSNTPVFLQPILEESLNNLMLDIVTGSSQTTTTVSTVVQDFSVWTLNELSEAIQDPSTDAELLVYLEHALNLMMTDLFSGGQPEFIIVATPVGLLPSAPVDAVMVPMPAETVVDASSPTASAASPLVQIIVNVKSQQEAAPVVPSPVLPPPVMPEVVINPQPVVLPPPVMPEVVINPQPVVLPAPVLPEVVINPQPVVLPAPVLPEVVINPQPVVLPAPVLPEVVINPQPVVLPSPVAPEVVVAAPGSPPVDIIAVNPSGFNPIDVVAIQAPEY